MLKRYRLFLIVPLFFSNLSVATESYGPTEAEKAFLPPYCGGPGGGDWKAILGPDIIWNNHTCYGINRLNRYHKSKNMRDGKRELETAINEFGYSIGHLKPDFKLMPEIYMYRGVTYKFLARQAEAIADLNKSISLDPKYTRSITELADIYNEKLTNPKKALELVSEGLRHNPDAPALQRRYIKYGGKLPYPTPYKNNNSGVTSNQPNTDKTEPPQGNNQESEKINIPEKTLPKVIIEDTPAANPQQPTMRSQSNPWCRFCPEPPQTNNPATSSSQAAPKAEP